MARGAVFGRLDCPMFESIIEDGYQPNSRGLLYTETLANRQRHPISSSRMVIWMQLKLEGHLDWEKCQGWCASPSTKGKGFDKGNSSNKLSKQSEVLIKMSCNIWDLMKSLNIFEHLITNTWFMCCVFFVYQIPQSNLQQTNRRSARVLSPGTSLGLYRQHLGVAKVSKGKIGWLMSMSRKR